MHLTFYPKKIKIKAILILSDDSSYFGVNTENIYCNNSQITEFINSRTKSS